MPVITGISLSPLSHILVDPLLPSCADGLAAGSCSAVVGHGVSEEIVASSIRSAISTAWKRADREIWYLYLPTIPRDRDSAPTNAEVIAGLARITELWKGCADAYLRQRGKEVVSCEQRELLSGGAFQAVP